MIDIFSLPGVFPHANVMGLYEGWANIAWGDGNKPSTLSMLTKFYNDISMGWCKKDVTPVR